MSKKTREWKDKLNRRFDIKQSISGRWIYCLNDSDDEENEYSYLDDFISDLLAKEKMELVERIEGVARHHNIERIDGKWMVQERLHLDPRETYAKIQVLDDVLSALKSEIQEEAGGSTDN